MAVVAATAIGFALGSSAAPNQQEADDARAESFRAAFSSSKASAFRQARRRGTVKGLKQGRARAKQVGLRRGDDAGAKEAGVVLAEIAQEEAEAAAQAEAEERAENCGAPLFVEGYCPTDEEIEQENLAESVCGSPDPESAAEEELYGIEC
ncbi:MAG TPA: hypothetical protein VFS54_10980 [Solirubrobacterales bacterium]|nr:hypothetical protein [Solirubrobacterales bacterium]